MSLFDDSLLFDHGDDFAFDLVFLNFFLRPLDISDAFDLLGLATTAIVILSSDFKSVPFEVAALIQSHGLLFHGSV